MDQSDFEAWETRIRARAEQLWREAGRPDGGSRAFIAQARELLAMKEVPVPTLDPKEDAEPVVEEASIQGNLGEFPTLTDQGEEQTYPHEQDDDGPRLSDGDASAQGGVLPQEDEPETDLPQVTEAQSDITSSSVNAEDGPENPDINDDGMPDVRDLDDEVEGEIPRQ
jgi:hypothetical protein